MPLKVSHEEQPTLNLTSMIDVLFLLIMFFMAGTKFTEAERNIGLNVPKVSDSGALTAAPEKKVVNVYKDGQITLDRQNVSIDELTARLSEARRNYRDLGVTVRGDGTGQFQLVADVLSACRQAGIGDLAISVRINSTQR